MEKSVKSWLAAVVCVMMLCTIGVPSVWADVYQAGYAQKISLYTNTSTGTEIGTYDGASSAANNWKNDTSIVKGDSTIPFITVNTYAAKLPFGTKGLTYLAITIPTWRDVADGVSGNTGKVDLSKIKDIGILYFNVYLDTDSTTQTTGKDLDVYLETTSYVESTHVKLTNVKSGQWNLVAIPLKDLAKSGFDFSKILQIRFIQTANFTNIKWDIYAQDIGFWVPPTFTSLTISNLEGASVTQIKAGEKYSFSMDCVNSEGVPITPAVIIAVYNGDALRKTYIEDDVTVENEASYTFSIDNIDIPQDITNPLYKIFVWESLNTLKPYKIFT